MKQRSRQKIDSLEDIIATKGVRYHDPYKRLAFRKSFETLMQEKLSQEKNLRKIDMFSLFDAVAKRGGFEEVSKRHRWGEIEMSLVDAVKAETLSNKYNASLFALEDQLFAHFPKCRQSACKFKTELIEAHLLLPSTRESYYELSESEKAFSQTVCQFTDEYFNLKTIAQFEKDFRKIPIDFQDKYLLIKKWVLLHSHSKVSLPFEMHSVYVKDNLFEICIIGLSLPTLLIANHLSQFGVQVTIIDNQSISKQDSTTTQITENGIVFLKGGMGLNSYYNNLKTCGVALEQLPRMEVGLILDKKKSVSEDKLRQTEELFLNLLEKLKKEFGNRNKLYEELMKRVMRKRYQNEKALIKWHYDRYFLFNKLKGDKTEVSDLRSYEKFRSARLIQEKHFIGYVKNYQSLLTQLKSRPNVSILKSTFIHAELRSAIWNITFISEDSSWARPFSHVIYSDTEVISKCLADGDFRVTQISGDYVGQGFNVLHQLTFIKYVTTLYKFTDPVSFIDPVQNLSAFSVQWSEGFVYFFVVLGGFGVLALAKINYNPSKKYFQQFLHHLDKYLNKPYTIAIEENCCFETSFALKEEKFLDSVIKVREKENLFFMLPILTTKTPYRLQSQLQIVETICSSILMKISDKAGFDLYAKIEQFKPAEEVNKGKQQESQIAQIKAKGSQVKQLQDSLSIQQAIVPEEQQKYVNQNKLLMPKHKIMRQLINPFKHRATEYSHPNATENDWFGLHNPIISNYESYLKKQFQSMKLAECFRIWDSLALVEPLMLTSVLQLYSLGIFYSQHINILDANLRSSQQSLRNSVYLLNHLITRREGLSLYEYLHCTVYFQCLMVIEGVLYYIVIDEKWPKISYYHTDLQTLVGKISAQISINQSQQGFGAIGLDHPKIVRTNISTHPPDTILFQSIRNMILDELKQDSRYLNDILQSKLNSTNKHNRQNSILSSDTTRQGHCLQSKSELSAAIVLQLQAYLAQLIQIQQLKDFTVVDVFFGKLSDQFLACEILRQNTSESLQLEQIQQNEKELYEELKVAQNKIVLNTKNALKIISNQHIQCHRNFLSQYAGNFFERYALKWPVQEQSDCSYEYYILEVDGTQHNFGKKKEIIPFIIQRLLDRFSGYEILHSFKQLLNSQVLLLPTSPKLLLYYKMTRIQCRMEDEQTERLINKFKDLPIQKKQIVYQALQSGKIQLVNNELIMILN